MKIKEAKRGFPTKSVIQFQLEKSQNELAKPQSYRHITRVLPRKCTALLTSNMLILRPDLIHKPEKPSSFMPSSS